jgi:hypothetical protein
MWHGVTYGTRLRIAVAQFIRDFPGHLVSEVTAGFKSWFCVGESCGMKREHSRAGVAVVHTGLIPLLNACAIYWGNEKVSRPEVCLRCLITH